MSVKGTTRPQAFPASTSTTQATPAAQPQPAATDAGNAQSRASSAAPSGPAQLGSTQQGPVQPTATARSAADAHSARANDVTAARLQQRVAGGGLGDASTPATVEGHGVNRGSSALVSASGPLPAGAWDDPGQHILGRLTQHSARGAADGVSDDNRCGGANVLGAAVMQGREPTARLLERTADASGTPLNDADRTQLRSIAADVRAGRATYEQLNAAQDLVYRGGNTTQPFDEVRDQARARLSTLPAADRARFNQLDTLYNRNAMTPAHVQEYSALISRATGVATQPRIEGNSVSVDVTGTRSRSVLAGGMSDAELAAAARNGGASAVAQRALDATHFDERGRMMPLREQLAALEPGQSAIVRVAGSAEAARSGDANHFITVGRRPDGTPFIYNPDPTRGQATCYVGNGSDPRNQPADFQREILRYEDRVSLFDSNGEAVQATVVTP